MKLSIHLLPVIFFLSFITTHAFAQRSLYSDVRAHKLGDVITVVLAENINGSSSNNASSQISKSGRGSIGVTGNVFSQDATFSTSSENEKQNNQRILANQRQLLTGSLSVRISEIQANGSYLIEGSRLTEISGEIYTMSLKGYIRPEDIDDVNQILSYRIANAEIVYFNQPNEDKSRKRRGFGKAIIWTVGAIAVAFTAAAG